MALTIGTDRGARMTLRTRRMGSVILGILGVTGFVGVRALGRRGRRPSGRQLLNMSDADFASFIRKSGVKTVTSAGLVCAEGTAD
jgi:hypothetical protein